jgi:PAS domain S-box-containing protein
MPEDILRNKQPSAMTSKLDSQQQTEPSLASEELFRFMVKSVKDYAIFATDSEGRVISWNTGAERIFGYTENEILGQDASIIFTPEDIESGKPEEELRTAEREGRAEDERWHVRKDGIRFWASGIVTPLRDEGGNLRGFVKVARDQTEQKQAEEERHRSEQELTDFFENAVVGLHWVGPDGIILRANQAELDLLGYTRDEYIGHHIAEFHAEPEAINDILGRLMRNETLHSYEARLRSKDGSIRHVLISSNVLRQGEKFVHTRCFTRDITERKMFEMALKESEEQFRAVAETAADVIITIDEKSVILFVNQATEDVFGYSPHELIGQQLTLLMPEYLRHLHRAGIERYVETGQKHIGWKAVELPGLHKDGHEIPLEISFGEFTGAGGHHFTGIARDITERKHREQAQTFLAEASRVLASSLDYQTTLASVAQMAVPNLANWCAVDVLEDDREIRRLAVAHVDPSKVEWAKELHLRYPEDRNAEHGLPNVLRTGQPEIYPEIPDSLLVAGARDAEHLQIMREIGFTSAMIVPLSAHGRTLGAISFVTAESGRRYGPEDLALAEDLARRAATAIDNALLYRDAQEANRLKDEFLATVSHELRTPLTAVLGWAHMLRAGQLDDENASRALETIERNARSQAQLIDDLLDVSRIITGKLRLDIRPVDPTSFIDAAIDAVSPAAEAKGVRIQKVMDTGVSAVSGDPARLQQVVWNLLSNAIKFTPRGGRVKVLLERINSHIEITVSDTGAGISEKFLPFVFERFRQADGTTTRLHGGLGLGLAIVRHLVELHGGSVHVESLGEGQGATFTVKLPLITVYERERRQDRVHPAARDVLPAPDCPEKLDGLKVLVVDDEADTRELLRAVLGRCGAEVTTAGSAEEALDLLKQSRPDVLVSDIGMPGEDGYELIKKVRALSSEDGGKIPAIALTAYARAEDRLQVLRAGYQMHVAKPVELTELVAIVATLAGWNVKA